MHVHSVAIAGSLALSSLVSAIPVARLSREARSENQRRDASAGNPFSFPLSNGFPNIVAGSQQEASLFNQAHGTLPNGPPPPTAPAEDDLLSLRLIAFNELWEVAFFTELLANITNNIPGYEFEDPNERQAAINAITAVQAQEQLHALDANGALAHFNAGPIQPCQYVAPVSNFQDAVAVASQFTDVVLGTLGDVVTHFGENGDSGLIRGVASVIGQEGEQDGYYRSLLGKVPSANAFLTASAREFAFNAINQNFVVPGSCPNANTINLPTYGVLTLETPATQITAQDTTLAFSIPAEEVWSQYPNGQGLSLILINQQNVPINQTLAITGVSDDLVQFTANFPFEENSLFGLTIAVVAAGEGLTDIATVAENTVFGPVFINVL
ncbi:hypothetical protein B0A52_08087 [Exophiala mesophila]|uniref:Late sexual development protein n=1 Tax=Exophiala mesophila TaxID=212818 RepID=A0A438MZZ5_EXOME|nr:hypothetical protein B0A52_08087 [Exophiala mesophila]